MKIIQLQASNIKKLKAIELSFDENKNLIILSGRNGQGKSSVLDAIWWALGGTKNIQDKPIREGQESAESIVTLEAEKNGQKVQYIVTRTFTDKGNYLKVNNPDGSTYSNPQAFLDYIVGHLSFDPLEFSRFDSKKKIEELKNILKLDFTELDEKKNQFTEDRLLVGREGKCIKRWPQENVDEAIKLKDATELSVVDLSTKLQTANEQRTRYCSVQTKISENTERLKDFKERIAHLENEINELQTVEDTKEDLEGLKNSISQVETNNIKVREAKQIMGDVEAIGKKEVEYKELTDKIKAIDVEKTNQLSKAELPIEGLSWDEGTVLYKGIPFDQISSGEQLRVSMAIAMASNPKLKLIIIKDGSLLDKDNLSIIAEMSKGKDFTVFVEKVDDSGKLGIYIEDGEIKAIN